MFHELKEILSRNKRFEECYNVKYFKETKCLKSLQKLNVHKTFRRCPRRLLNVLCTFSLRPVSTSFYRPCEKQMGKSLLHPFALIFRFHSKIKGPLLGLRLFLMIESLSKLMKNAFYFMLKLFSLLRYLHLCPDFLVM